MIRSQRPTRRDVVCALAFWAAVGAAWTLDTIQGNRDLPIQGAFLAAVWLAISAIGTWIASNAATVAITIGQAAWMIAKAFAEFGILLGHLLARIPGVLKSFWTSVLRPFATWTFDQIEALARWLEDTFAPLIKIINDIRTWIDKFWTTYIQPVLDTIEVIRRALQILEKFGVDLAARLDAELAKLEDKIMMPILEIRQALNVALNWINRIVTLDGLLQRIMLLQSIWRDIGDTFAMLHNVRQRGLTAEDRDRIRTGGGAKSPAQVTSDVRTYLSSGAGPLAEYVEMGVNAARSGSLGG